MQAEIEHRGQRARFDDAFGAGWRLVTLAEPVINGELKSWFAGIGGLIVSVGCGTHSAVDVDGAYRKWFADHGVVAALQRPDFTLFGTATDVAQMPGLLRRAARRAAVGLRIDLQEVP